MVHPWAHRIAPYENHFEFDQFVYSWLHPFESLDPTNPVMSITNGWGARHHENQWWADEMYPKMGMFAYDSRGQGDSIKTGELDAIQGAIDANRLVGQAFDEFDRKAMEAGVEPGNKIIQGNCIGAMTVSALFAGKFDIAKRAAGTILISPVSTFNLPTVAKSTYFMPSWMATWAIRYLAEPLAKMMVSGDESEFSRQKALERVRKMDVDAALKQSRQIFWKENVEKLWSQIDVPSLMLVSPADPLTRIEESADVYHRLKYPIWMELEAPDHLILEDNINFLRELVPRFAAHPWEVYEEYKHIVPSYSL